MNDQVASAGGRRGPGGEQAKLPSGTTTTAAAQPYLHDLVPAVSAPAMALSGPDGQVRAGGAQGIYFRDVRAISQLLLTVGGQEPVPLGHDLAGGATSRFHGTVRSGCPEVDPRVFVVRQRDVDRQKVTETFTISCYTQPALARQVELKLSSDLAVIADVKAGLATNILVARASGRGLAWDCAGLGTVQASTDPAPDKVDPATGSFYWDVSVSPGQPIKLSVSIELVGSLDEGDTVSLPAPRSSLNMPEVDAEDQRLRQFVETSIADLDQLRMSLPGSDGEAFLAAGAPWYLTLFGRDAIWAARMLLPLGTGMALSTLRTLARLQGASVDPRTAEQPGKVLHEVRRDALAYRPPIGGQDGAQRPGLPPLYYGTVDATPLWVCLLHDTWRWGAPAHDIEGLLGPMQKCLRWMADFGCGPNGFVSYLDESGTGLGNQGWKDSFDGIQFHDGRLATAPLSLCEVQGYCYEAAMAGAELLDAFGAGGAERWRQFAADLAERFRAHFWVEDAQGPYPAIALDGAGRPVDAVSSNMGHLLSTGILDPEEAELVSRRLMGPDLNCGFGLRTMGRSSAGFNPLSYHCGSVWAHDTAIAIEGLCRSPAPSALATAGSLVQGLLDAAEAFGYQLPELYGGHQKLPRNRPLPYPAACRPQAWTAASSVAILSALAGICPDVPSGELILAPVASTIGLRRVDGFVLDGQRVGIIIDPSGQANLVGGPSGLNVVRRAA